MAFRKHTLLPLDDCLYALQESIPHLTRSSLHRCLQRHDISRLPDVPGADGKKKPKKKFKKYPIGYVHIDIAEVHTAEGRLYLFVAIDGTSKFVYVELQEKATRRIAGDFLKAFLKVIPYNVHTILTDNGVQFTDTRGQYRTTKEIQHCMANKELFLCTTFELICAKEDIDYRRTKPAHPWTNGQVERMNRTIKEATTKRYHYDSHQQLKQHLYNFINAYNFAKRLKTLKGLTPYEYIISCWQSEPERFKSNPNHHSLGLNTYIRFNRLFSSAMDFISDIMDASMPPYLERHL